MVRVAVGYLRCEFSNTCVAVGKAVGNVEPRPRFFIRKAEVSRCPRDIGTLSTNKR